ncbi:MAG: endonuclease/exonuclease/phosphatase family protein [Clostridia bacterium]|nr:endonuclease/exonuclease/phosphatase family protein [Clostridia bacterium]
MSHNCLTAALLVTAVLITAATVSACTGADAPSDDTSDAITADAPELTGLELISDGKTAFTIVRSDSADDDATVSLLNRLKTAFKEKAGVSIALDNDWVKKGSEPDSETYEILFGPTNHPESAQALEGVKYSDFVIKMIGNKIVINGYTVQTRAKAVTYFITNILSRAAEGQDLIFTEADNYVSESKYLLETVTLGGQSLADYTITVADDASYVAQDFARRLRSSIAGKSGYYLPIAETAEGKIISVTDGGDGEWSASLADGTLTCTAGGMWGWDLLYDAVNDTFRGAKDSLALENGWSVSGSVSASDDKEIVRSQTIDGDIRVMYHNVWSGAVYNRDDMEAELYLSYMPDVIGLQEISANIRGEEVSLFDLLADEYTEVEVKATNKSGNNYTPILYRAERLELIDAGWHLYNDNAGDQSKSITWAVFRDKTTGKQFGVANTHFYWTSDEKGKAARLIDAQEIAKVVADVQAKYSVPLVIGGDLNCGISSDPQKNLTQAGWVNAHDGASVYRSESNGHHSYAPLDELTGLYANGPMPTGTYDTAIDHIYTCGGGLEVRVFNTLLHRYALDASDHCPIYVDLKFES